MNPNGPVEAQTQLTPSDEGGLFDVFGHRVLIRRESTEWRVYSLGADGKRTPANFVIPDFIVDSELEQFLFDLFHESAGPGSGEIRRLR